MLFRHGMVDGDKILIFHVFYGDGVFIIGFFRFQGGQRNAAAADHGITQRMDGVASDRADIEL